jgi:predicted nucleic acid-binding protein
MPVDSRLLQFEEGERLLNNPKIGDVKRKSFEAVVLEAFIMNAPDGITKEQIFTHCSNVGVPNLSELLISDILASLEIENNIQKQGDIYKIDNTYLSDLNGRIKLANDNITALFKVIEDRLLSKIVGMPEDKKIKWANELIHAVLNDVFKTYAESLISVYAGKPSILSTDLLDIIINKHSLDLKVEENRCSEYVDALKDTLLEQFHDPQVDFARGIREIANRMIIMRTLANNPDVKFVGGELFENTTLFIDNNVLISLLCPDTPFHSITQGLITETKKLKGKVILTDWTEEEWTYSIDHATRLIEGQSKLTDAESVTNEIIGSFLHSGRPRKEWVDYISGLNKQYSIYKKDELFKYQVEPKGFKTNEVKELSSQLCNYLNRHPEVIKHDAKMLLLIQERRMVSEATIGTTWFLSRDTKLRTTENAIMKNVNFNFESIMPLEIWFEILLPFCQSEGVFEETIDFTKLIGARIIPIPADLAERYVNYL